jgi:putative ABC transport system ATP-binding protein
MSASIVFDNVTKRYEASNGAMALRCATFSVYPGEVTVLMGPSGSGKTTLLTLAGGLLGPTSGQITVCGLRLDTCSESRRQEFRREQIGFVFQNYNLLSSLTAQENIQVAFDLRSAKASALDALEHVGLAEKARAYPDELSGGQRQRVAIARALAGDPPVLLADEPTAALDASHGRRVMVLLRERARKAGTTVLVVTHDARVREFADRVIEMEDGRVRRIVRRQSVDRVLDGEWMVQRNGTIVAEIS